jgi:hypothetical protein
MTMNLDHVFSGKGVWRAHNDHHNFVNKFPGDITKVAQVKPMGKSGQSRTNSTEEMVEIILGAEAG